MKTPRRAKRLLAAAATVGLGMTAMAACLPADGTTQTITFAGSDTTENVMAAIADHYNADTTYNADPDVVVNVLSRELDPAGKLVPGDASCGDITYATPADDPGEVLAPNGSSNGRNALKASIQNGDGCVDVARSSGPPRAIGSDLATFEYYAFALDAMGWASASTKAPTNLTLAQLQGIYNCTFTDWSQVGGQPGPIQRYVPQTGSGTYQFFISDLITFDPALFSGPSCPAVIYAQENSGELIAANGDQETAIVGYSAGNWVAQARGTAPEQRSGQVVYGLNGQDLVVDNGDGPELNTAGPVVEGNVKLVDPTPSYPGIRFVFNVVDSTHVNYSQAQRLVGFVNQTPQGEPCGDAGEPACNYPGISPLCNGDLASIVESYGFGLIDDTVGPRNLPGSNCRLFTP